MVEHVTFNHGVESSNLSTSTTQVPLNCAKGGYEESLMERAHALDKVGGSKQLSNYHKRMPIGAKILLYAELAQLGEQLPYKQWVGSSSLSFRTILWRFG